ncbi:MAG: CaiB/BaiF CoA transferase family protein [bacterium]
MLLAGIRVLDFGRYIAGPFCAALLADMGAEVIRIERVHGGEDRYLASVADDGSGALFMAANRNKKGITLNPMKPEGQDIVRKLVATADMVIANLPLSALKQMKIDYDSLKAIREDLILVTATAYGTEGPYADRVGFDTVAQAVSGAMHLTGFDGQPTRNIVLFEDYGTAMFAAYGAMCALLEREKSGKGQLVETSLLSTGLNFMSSLFIEHQITGIMRKQQGNRAFWAAPADTYQTSDGWIVVSVVGNGFFKRWTELVGRPELFEHPDLQNDAARAEQADLLDEIMVPWCRQRTTEQALKELEQAKISCGPVYDIQQALDDPQVQACQLLKAVTYPGIENPVSIIETPVRLSRTPGSIRTAAPTLGQDTQEILTELGYSQVEIEELRAKDVI